MSAIAADLPERNTAQALWRGFKGRCPSCGQGRLFGRYLKVEERCGHCGEELHHHRADDAPPYFTILIVGHVLALAMVAVMSTFDELPAWVDYTLWPGLVLLLCLMLLPRVKGALVGLQWAQRMHGFGDRPTLPRPLQRPEA